MNAVIFGQALRPPDERKLSLGDQVRLMSAFEHGAFGIGWNPLIRHRVGQVATIIEIEDTGEESLSLRLCFDVGGEAEEWWAPARMVMPV